MKKTTKLPNKENENLTSKDGCVKYVPKTSTELFAEYEYKVRELLNKNKNRLLFRGKRVDNGEWLYSMGLQVSGGIELWNDNENTWSLIDENTLSKSVGLCDKNEKNIFEGDIVQLVVKAGYEHKRYEVFYDIETAQWLLKNGNNICDCEKLYGQQARCNMEVIGNIYDNPELLECRMSDK